ncbi:hypothetical protein BDV34DRAFT_199874 [Aspergillus parasiticus]|uniref:Uncharacterized protein n=1 Tax=Aspergillus parasiticus TaxID=5067 RepID=A0A5N6DD17_ASPPA|nr:hypothetical protein BDV34DRAFT_199874 [Aspergillus parasiticus]
MLSVDDGFGGNGVMCLGCFRSWVRDMSWDETRLFILEALWARKIGKGWSRFRLRMLASMVVIENSTQIDIALYSIERDLFLKDQAVYMNF